MEQYLRDIKMLFKMIHMILFWYFAIQKNSHTINMQTLNQTYTDLPSDAITIDEAVTQIMAYAHALEEGGGLS